MVIKVDLASWREERMSQFSCDAVETMMQVGLQTVRVVDGVEACQDRETHAKLRAEEGTPYSINSAACVDYSRGMMNYERLASVFTMQDDNHSSHCH